MIKVGDIVTATPKNGDDFCVKGEVVNKNDHWIEISSGGRIFDFHHDDITDFKKELPEIPAGCIGIAYEKSNNIYRYKPEESRWKFTGYDLKYFVDNEERMPWFFVGKL